VRKTRPPVATLSRGRSFLASSWPFPPTRRAAGGERIPFARNLQEAGPAHGARGVYPFPRREESTIATKEEKLEMEGEVVEAFPNGMFKVKLDAGQEVLGYTAGKMRRFRIKIFPGDRVKIELSPYDLTKGRIVYRFK
jgi:translation initiation factor IF-1